MGSNSDASINPEPAGPTHLGLKVPSDTSAAAAALREIDRLVTCLHTLVYRQDAAAMSHRVYAYVSEVTWWIAALDEQLREENKGRSYEIARNAHEYGRLILGVLWVRDRVSHQLPLTVVKDDRSFFNPRRGGVFHISAGYEWLPTDRIPKGYPRPEWERVYDEHFAEVGVVQNPARIAQFLREILESDEACAKELRRIADHERTLDDV